MKKKSIKDMVLAGSAFCNGCMACIDACPAKAIDESFTAEGFRIPLVNDERCVKCGRCVDVCSLHYLKNMKIPLKILSAQAKDERVLMHCSSGGVFALLAYNAIQDGGVVIGAVFDKDRKDVCHVSSEEYALEEILRSKYVQSNTIGIYRKVKKYLSEGRNVLFAGTPCQVRALLLYLRGEQYRGTLRTVDFMCHGVPPTKMFLDFVKTREKKEKSKALNVTFREKDKGWHTEIMKVYFEDGSIWKRTALHIYYYYMFIHNYTLRDSCYTCDEYQSHMADITLADHWTASERSDSGISLVIINSSEGNEMIQSVSGELNAIDISANMHKNLKMYSHKYYNHKNKEKWLESFQKTGYFGTKTFFFWRVGAMQIMKTEIRKALGSVKRRLFAMLHKRRDD